MTTTDPLLCSDFFQEVIRQMRSFDPLGNKESWSEERLLEPFVISAERARSIPIVGDPSPETVVRVQAFANAIAVLVEKECGHMAKTFLNLSHEGFGTLLIIVGKLVVVERVMRDVHRFGFPSLSRMKDEADKLLSVAVQRVGDHPQVAGL
ncbi:MAG: NifX-associated nitrogen fixation protein [Magnetococcales bacterium]|nr:NifX-associated nitrogen fixation protein [Magnetococcales bacterium]